MVWMQAARRGRFGPTTSPLKQDGDGKIASHVEDANHDTQKAITNPPSSVAGDRQFPFAPESLPDDALPFIPTEVVLARGKQSQSAKDQQNDGTSSKQVQVQVHDSCWIVIDNIVFDCRDFISEHPGGQEVILSFVGEDCSWQFWRLHGKNVMEQYGRALRVGRTEGVQNRFVEPVRYVGLSRLGDDGW